jgi:hypothetical protein
MGMRKEAALSGPQSTFFSSLHSVWTLGRVPYINIELRRVRAARAGGYTSVLRLFGFVFIAVIAVIQMHLVGTELHPPSVKNRVKTTF